MEARVTRFQDLLQNPWFRMMNLVLEELRIPKNHRSRIVSDGWVFHDLPLDLLRKRSTMIKKNKSLALKTFPISESSSESESPNPAKR